MWATFNAAGAENSSLKAPTFTCTDSEKTAYRIWISGEKKMLQVQSNGTVTEIRLADANFGRPFRGPGKALVYNGWREGKGGISGELEMAHEFRVLYSVEKNVSRVQVSLVMDHRERTGLQCKSTSLAAVVVPFEKETPLSKSYALQFADFAKQRSSDGRLTSTAILGMESALRRFSFLAAFKNSNAKVQFIQEILEPVKRIHPDSAKELEKHVPAGLLEFWKGILSQAQYAYFPEVQRYTGWVIEGGREGSERDMDSIIAGFNVFTTSTVFKEKDIRDFFVKEVTPILKKINEGEAAEIRGGLRGLGQTLFNDLWIKAAGKRTIADYPEIESMASNIGLLAEESDFEPEKVASLITSFYRSQMAQDPEAKLLFSHSAGIELKKLTPRQKEDVQAWLDTSVKSFYLELIK